MKHKIYNYDNIFVRLRHAIIIIVHVIITIVKTHKTLKLYFFVYLFIIKSFDYASTSKLIDLLIKLIKLIFYYY